jgi:dynein heavy chain
MDGLEDQLLALVVKKERPDLEEQKAELIRAQNGFKIKLKELEDGLLFKLANAEGDILEDIELIENLEDTKRISVEISEKVVIAKETEIQINEARESYRTNASRGSLLFFILNDLFKINSYYYYSLNAFVIVFERAIDIAGKAEEEQVEEVAVAASQNESVLEKVNPFKKFKTDTRALKEAYEKALEAAENPPEEEEVDDEALEHRLEELMSSITFTVLAYVRRGLFEAHKLIVVTQLTIKVLLKAGTLPESEVAFLIGNEKATHPPPMTNEVAGWLTESAWSAVVQLKESVPEFGKLKEDLEQNWKKWKQWNNESNPEVADLPGEWQTSLTPFQRILLLNAFRPDRLTTALITWVKDEMGDRYIEQESFNIKNVYRESNPSQPMFFVLFPGSDIYKDLQPICEKYDYTMDNGKFVNISMGQGQEKGAEDALDKFTQTGGWVFLQNIHLMQNWVPILERKLEIAAEKGHKNFRCFLSAEPPPLPYMKIVPESIMQSSIKIANEPPQNVKANLRRAWSNFSQTIMDAAAKPKEYRTILFAVCWFHSVMLGRHKFGTQGWSRKYGFNTGDLTICSDVLNNYLRNNDVIPWDDLRYIFGEIMYGGHITDNWDRRVNTTYLLTLVKPELFDEMELAPGFPAKVDGTYEEYRLYIEEKLPPESPILFGLHPNAEISFLNAQGTALLGTIQDLGGGTGGGGGGTGDRVREVMEDFLDRMPGNFHMVDISLKVAEQGKPPYLMVMMQEAERMNGLLSAARLSLDELKLGLEGALNISDAMEALSNALALNRVPDGWTKVAYASLKLLGDWFANMLQRVEQLLIWTDAMKTPPSLWLSGLFNPMAFVTAVMQVTSRLHTIPLDSITTRTEVTTVVNHEEVEGQPEDGAFIHGWFLQGARWDVNSGQVKESILKELFPSMPVVHLTAIPKTEEVKEGIYVCPVYTTASRGAATFVFPAGLKTSENPFKWALAGVAILQQVEA